MIKTAMRCLVSGMLCTLAMHLPFIGLLFGFLAIPLMIVFPALGETGDFVDIGSAWITLKSPFAWIAFIAYFALLFAGVFKLIGFFRRKRGEESSK